MKIDLSLPSLKLEKSRFFLHSTHLRLKLRSLLSSILFQPSDVRVASILRGEGRGEDTIDEQFD